MRILITEDDAISRRVLKLFLSPYGKVDAAGRGDEAFEMFSEAHRSGAPYSLVCLDLHMPGKPGLEVLAEIRLFEKETGVRDAVPVLLLTGSANPDQINKAKALGASKHLLKPVVEADLIAYLRELGLIE